MQGAVLGLRWGGDAQRALHRALNGKTPQGWSTQISDGGEPSFLYSVERKMEFCRGDPSRIQCLAKIGASAGYYSNVNTGVSFRVGKILSEFWSDFGPAMNRTGGAVKLRDDNGASDNFEFYAFTSISVDYVIYNALLQGQLRDNVYEINSRDIARAVPSGAMGLAISVKARLLKGLLAHFSYSRNFKGKEIKWGQEHWWGSVWVGCTYQFSRT